MKKYLLGLVIMISLLGIISIQLICSTADPIVAPTGYIWDGPELVCGIYTSDNRGQYPNKVTIWCLNDPNTTCCRLSEDKTTIILGEAVVGTPNFSLEYNLIEDL